MRFLPLAVLLSLACGGSGEGSSAGARLDGEVAAIPEAIRDTTTFLPFPAAGVPSWTPVRERGIGIVHLDPGPVLSGRAEDTLIARSEQGVVLVRLIADSTAVYRFEARPGALDQPEALEFGYEEVGLPLLDGSAERDWAVHLGTRAGVPVTGWVRQQPGRSARTLWEELLPTIPVFFVVPPDSVRFHASVDGPEVPLALPPPPAGQDPASPGDYILWPLERQGDWMQVRAVTPSDYCADPPAPMEDTLWIRWRSDDGRPRVWYFTRGC